MAAALAIAAGTVAAGYLASRAQNKATAASTKSTNEALAYTKERSALGDADYQQRLNDYYKSRDALLSRYGVSVPGLSQSAPMPPPVAGPAAAGAGGFRAPAGAIPRPVTPTRIGGVPSQASIPEMMQARAEGTDWNDWERYGLGSRAV